ncbi:pepM [Acanthosepion pharaonis]|uniref:PepM n=1 Tax=Acanthosepion pharaonis TaxID=158019 RepID=A0A812DN63_ACAPH|nr:pepM [Sepia pharaonis]
MTFKHFANTFVRKQYMNGISRMVLSHEFSCAAPGKICKTKQLKQMLESPKLEFIMEGHNGLSARIVQEAGFKGIWGSGLSISAQLGVRDSNEASWTQILDVMEYMSDATDIPILLDADTGYGNFNNARRLVRKLEERGVAGKLLFLFVLFFKRKFCLTITI